MANKHNGEVGLIVGSKKFTLKLTSNKAAEAEMYGIGNFFTDLQLSFGAIRALLFVMVKGDSGINSIDDAGDLMDEDLSAVTDAVAEAIGLFTQKLSPKKA